MGGRRHGRDGSGDMGGRGRGDMGGGDIGWRGDMGGRGRMGESGVMRHGREGGREGRDCEEGE